MSKYYKFKIFMYWLGIVIQLIITIPLFVLTVLVLIALYNIEKAIAILEYLIYFEVLS